MLNVLLASVLLFCLSKLVLIEFVLCSKDPAAAHIRAFKLPGLTEVSNSFIDLGIQESPKTG